MESRAPGIIAAAILSDCFVGMIADGIHVEWDALRVALAARPRADRSFLVSDAMPTVGGPDHFTLYGKEIHVEGGRLVNANGNLAGAHVSLLDCVLRLHQNTGLPLGYALAMATDIPRRAMRLAPQRIAPAWRLAIFWPSRRITRWRRSDAARKASAAQRLRGLQQPPDALERQRPVRAFV
ncbi:hypothetical protein QWZ10_15730 [Paracoccus cavernae]|uniref:N-acetylglucosamine-6-phosphate deacetylase n=1 Tax=Paracoccus cavernae TaxID=1571207 RepID=A0ABT8D7Y4_9RHOB|nr:hypothetical protein [Paracoccus cavernae]